jgi:hypothetical protein
VKKIAQSVAPNTSCQTECITLTAGKSSPKLQFAKKKLPEQALTRWAKIRRIWDRCYDFLNIFAKKLNEKIGVFDSKQS